MAPFSTLLTHPGGAHKDEFLACSLLLAVQPVPIVRREPTAADLEDPAVGVVDVGLRHEPDRNNFDHHQLPKDHPPTCSLSLVLQHLGRYDDARAFFDWLETAEWFDARGPFDTAKWLGVDRAVLSKLNSPADGTLLRRFALVTRLEPGDALWEIMRMIGEDILTTLTTLRSQLDQLAADVEFWTFDLPAGPAQVLFLSRNSPAMEDPSPAFDRFVEQRQLAGQVVALVYPDRRGAGYGLTRFRDDTRLDFTRVTAQPDVHFAHPRGFVAKTSATEPERLKQLLRKAAGL